MDRAPIDDLCDDRNQHGPLGRRALAIAIAAPLADRGMDADVEDPTTDPQRRRKGDRKPVRMIASVRERSSTAHDAVISNLSRTGCQVSNIFLRAGNPIWVRFGSLAPIESRVIWARSDVAGVQFTQPLHPAVLDHVTKTAVR